MDKHTLRKVYLEKRRSLTALEYNKRNNLLCSRLITFVKEKGFQKIHLFFSIQKFKEAELQLFLDWAYSQPNLQLVTSVSNLEEASMQHYLIGKDSQFRLNKWGIPEPVDDKPFDIKELDCVLVPMVIGSKEGHRIGYGKGYYDQFLMQCAKETIFIGLNLGPLIEGTIYTEQHDIRMDWMMTPFQLFQC